MCLDYCHATPDQRPGIILSPFVDSSSSSTLTYKSMTQLMRTCAQMIFAGYVTSDVQYLIDNITGDLTMIDFTEGTFINSLSNPTFHDVLAIQNFINEVKTNIPAKYLQTADDILNSEYNNFTSMKPPNAVSPEIGAFFKLEA